MDEPDFHKSPPPSPKERLRLVWVASFIFILFSFLVAQFYSIQILDGKKWATKALRQHYFIVNEPFKRGTFYSNSTIKKHHPMPPQQLVVDISKYHLYIDPIGIPSHLREEVSESLIQFLALQPEKKIEFREQFNKKSRSRKLAMWLSKETNQQISQWWQGYAKQYKISRNALFFVKDYQRSYPYGKFLGQVLHTIQTNKDEKTTQASPTGGLELYFNRYLQGKQGKRRLMRSPRHSFEMGEVISHPEHGADIYLTIDPFLQQIAEEEIERGVIRSKAKTGWAVMMDPRTGEILALAQYPFFYPPDYQHFFNDPERIENTKVKAVTDANEPGSVFKPFTVAIAMKGNEEMIERGRFPLFSPSEKIPVKSGHFPGRSRPIQDTSHHHYLNMDMAMQKSSNIYMGRLAERIVNQLGNEWYRRQLQLFGFGLKTKIELPAESPGVVPTPGKLHRNGALEWSVPTPFSLAIGHNIQINTIQLVRAFAVFANGGYLVEPTLVRKIIKKDEQGNEKVLLDHTGSERVDRFPRVLSEAIVDRVVESMRYVTKPGGTAVKADVPGYTELGKTSTPKKIIQGAYSEKLYCPLFTGFPVVKHPPFVLAVVMDEPEYRYIPGIGKNHNGGNCTAWVFRDIARRSLEYLGIAQDDPYGYPYGDSRHDLSKTEWMKETRQLQEMYKSWNNITEIKMKER